MVEKRFMLDDAGELIDMNTHNFIDYGEEVCDLLNELTEKNSKQQDFIDQLQDELVFFKTANVDILQRLERKNQDLQERNNRQCRELDKLYKLIEHQDWYKLNSIIQELKEADERLEREWGVYGD